MQNLQIHLHTQVSAMSKSMHTYTHISTHVFLITRLMFYDVLFMFVIGFVVLFYILCILCFCIVLFCVFLLLLCWPFPIFVQVYRQLPLGGNPTAVNKYHAMSNIHTYIPYLRMYVCMYILHYIYYILHKCDVVHTYKLSIPLYGMDPKVPHN
jgi:uncharacterized membrane protein